MSHEPSEAVIDPMPVFVIKAKDNLAPQVIAAYVRCCVDQDLHHMAGEVIKALEEVNAWRERHPDECKWPDHEHVPASEHPDLGPDALVPRKALDEAVAAARVAAYDEMLDGLNLCCWHREREADCRTCFPDLSALIAEHKRIERKRLVEEVVSALRHEAGRVAAGRARGIGHAADLVERKFGGRRA